MCSFSFYDFDLGIPYDEKALDKVGDSSILFEEESMKNQERRNSEVSKQSYVPNFDASESNNNLVNPIVRRSSRASKLPAHLNDYEVTLNYSTVRYPIQDVCAMNSTYLLALCA